jgi:hypothetical protein
MLSHDGAKPEERLICGVCHNKWSVAAKIKCGNSVSDYA